MKNLILASLSDSLNRYLKLDPASTMRLQALNNKCVIIQLLPLQIKIGLRCQNERLHLSTSDFENADADAIISGTPLQLVGVTLTKANRHRFFADDIKIEGDAALGQQILELFDEVEIDWEDKLSEFIGDIPAHHLGNFVRSLKSWAKSSEDSLANSLNEYLHEELILFPSAYALKDFYQDIDQLNMDTERLEAKLNYLHTLIRHEDAK